MPRSQYNLKQQLQQELQQQKKASISSPGSICSFDGVAPQHEVVSSDPGSKNTGLSKKQQKKIDQLQTELNSCPHPLKAPIGIMRKKKSNNDDDKSSRNHHTGKQPETNNRRSGYSTSHTRCMCSRRR